jgi:hypothetical protein
MLRIREIDIKTAKNLTDFDPESGKQLSRTKDVDYSPLEQWLDLNGIDQEDAELFAAKSYEDITTNHIKRLSEQGKHLVFTSGQYAYFASQRVASLMQDEEQSIYAIGEASAHNHVAYGSLIISSGVKQTRTDKPSILIVDNVNRSIGSRVPEDVSPEMVEKLLDIMGDGTMLIDTPAMLNLLLPKELEAAIERGLRKTGASPEPKLVSELLEEFQNDGGIGFHLVSAQQSRAVTDEIYATVDKTVIQFRAVAEELQGIAKGTAKTSDFCSLFGVDAIISLDCIKGAEKGGDLDIPGVVQFDSALWMNRKDIARYGEQTVGPQVKGKIPNATMKELNPIILEKAQEVAAAAVDPYSQAQRQVERVERNRQRPLFIDKGEGLAEEITGYTNAEAVAAVLKSDEAGQIIQMPSIARQLNKAMRGDWLDVATAGIKIPSAMAQHHAALMPWEVCNKDLPDGAIVAYYRSPFGNVGAATIAVNNLQILKTQDRESYNKDGVSYMPPWTSKNIAITDFDSDRNGYFVGFIAKNPKALTQNLRSQLAGITDPAAQYEAGRAAIDQLIQDGTELRVADYPLAVTEFIEANRPENKPLPIPKDKKVIHPILPGESISTSIGAAWIETAKNPIGKVANQAMILESLAQNITYAPPSEHETLLSQIQKCFQKIDPLKIISDDALQKAGLPALNLSDRIQQVIDADRNKPTKPLQEAVGILTDYAMYPMAKNLQVAVDIAKSNQGINEAFQAFSHQIAYDKHDLRNNLKSANVYLDRPLPNNIKFDPVGQNVELVNVLYDLTPSVEIDREDLNAGFRDLIAITHTPAQLHSLEVLVDKYRKLTEQLREADNRIREKRSEDRQPSAVITSVGSGKALAIEKVSTAQSHNDFNMIKLDGRSGIFEILDLDKAKVLSGSDKTMKGVAKYDYALRDGESSKIVGFISNAALQAAGLTQYVKKAMGDESREGVVELPMSTATTLPPYVLQNDIDRIHHQLNGVLYHIKDHIKGREEQMVSALWRSSAGMGIAMKIAPEQIIKHLDKVPEIVLYGASDLRCQSDVVVRIDNIEVDSRVMPLASIEVDGVYQPLGIPSRKTANLAPGTIVRADLTPALDPKVRLVVDEKMISVAPAPDFEREIATTPGAFIFQRNKLEIDAYLQTESGNILIGQVDSSSRSKITKPTMSGEYRRGLYMGKGRKLDMQVRSIVGHEPVARELLKGRQNPDKSVVLLNSNSANQVVERVPEVARARESPKPHIENSPPNLRILPTPVAATDSSKVRQIDSRYRPTRGELLGWYQAADNAGNEFAKEAVVMLGTKLATEFSAEGQKPPLDYSSPSVSVSPVFYGEMVKLQATYLEVNLEAEVDFEEEEDLEMVER